MIVKILKLKWSLDDQFTLKNFKTISEILYFMEKDLKTI